MLTGDGDDAASKSTTEVSSSLIEETHEPIVSCNRLRKRGVNTTRVEATACTSLSMFSSIITNSSDSKCSLSMDNSNSSVATSG
jgi:hypothetical protein